MHRPEKKAMVEKPFLEGERIKELFIIISIHIEEIIEVCAHHYPSA